jgi:ABC-2 type transport system permease protein
MNVVVYLLSIGSMALIGEAVPWKEVNLMHLAYYCLQLELGGICFGVSAFLRKGSLGVGLGIAVMLYFANLISNMAEVAEGLRYITPFAYCDGADIVTKGNLDLLLLGIGFLFTAAGIGSAFWKYCRKDIQ